MPTVLRVKNARVVIYPNDHPPPHVHAVGPGGALAKFNLNEPNGPVTLVEQKGFKEKDIAAIGEAVARELSAIYAIWRHYHG